MVSYALHTAGRQMDDRARKTLTDEYEKRMLTLVAHPSGEGRTMYRE